MRETTTSDLGDKSAVGMGDGARLGARPREGFTERYAGTIISLAVHIAVFVILSSTAVPRVSNASPRPEPLRIVFDQPATQEEVPVEVPEPPQTPEYEGAAQTMADEGADEGVAEGAENEVAAATAEAAEDGMPAETQVASIEPEAPELSERVKRYLDEQRAQVKELNAEVAREGSSEVAQRLRLARVKIEGQRWLETTEGEAEGVVRSMSTLGVPPEDADEVCARYGIRIILAQVDASDVTGGFLNRAETASGTYYNRVGKGQYQVFTFSERALARMVRIEREELAKRGHEPSSTRVLEVGYGIVQTPSGYDLGVKKFRVAPIELEP